MSAFYNYSPVVDTLLHEMTKNTIASSRYFHNYVMEGAPTSEELLYLAINAPLEVMVHFSDALAATQVFEGQPQVGHLWFVLKATPIDRLHLVGRVFARRLNQAQLNFILSSLPLNFEGNSTFGAPCGEYYFAKKFDDMYLTPDPTPTESLLYLALLEESLPLTIEWPSDTALLIAMMKTSDVEGVLRNNLHRANAREIVFTTAVARAPRGQLKAVWDLVPADFRAGLAEMYKARKKINDASSDHVSLTGNLDTTMIYQCQPEYLVQQFYGAPLRENQELILILRATPKSLVSYKVRFPSNRIYYMYKTSRTSQLCASSRDQPGTKTICHLKCPHLYITSVMPPEAEHLIYLSMDAEQIEGYWRIHNISPSAAGITVWSEKIEPLKIFEFPQWFTMVDMTMLLLRCNDTVAFVNKMVESDLGNILPNTIDTIYYIALLKLNGNLVDVKLRKGSLHGKSLALYLAYEELAAPKGFVNRNLTFPNY